MLSKNNIPNMEKTTVPNTVIQCILLEFVKGEEVKTSL